MHSKATPHHNVANPGAWRRSSAQANSACRKQHVSSHTPSNWVSAGNSGARGLANSPNSGLLSVKSKLVPSGAFNRPVRGDQPAA